MIVEGQQLGKGRYRLLNLISRSSVSEIYLAKDTQLSRQVAIKVILSENYAYPDADATKWRSRFLLREIEIIAKFNHPHILALLGYEEEFVNENMLTYLVMPFCPEGSLATWLKGRNSLLSPQDVVQIVQQATAALMYAHSKGIIHLNVKPSNLLIHSNKGNTSLPNLLLTNFRIIEFNKASLNACQTPYGTPLYMAPEQWNGHPVPATDQYALAIIAYELLIGRHPFQGTLEQLKHQHLNVEPQQPDALNPYLSKDIDEVILHALAKRPEDRFTSVSAFARAFEQAIHGNQKGENIQVTNSPSLTTLNSTSSSSGSSRTTLKRLVSGLKTKGVTMKANILLYCVLTGLAGCATGIAFNAAGLLSPLIANIASGLGALIALLAGSWAIVEKALPKDIWQNAKKLPVVSLSLITVVIAASLVTIYTYSSTDPYIHQGNLAFDDPLINNSKNLGWSEDKSSGCIFSKDGYHVLSLEQNYDNGCVAAFYNAKNFVFEVQMTIIHGDCGGILFHNNFENNTSYYFHICRNGSFDLKVTTGNKTKNTFRALAYGGSPSINSMNKVNIFAVAVINNDITLYANHQKLVEVVDNTYDFGSLGLVAEDDSNATEVLFANAKIWTL
jgi:eukaryotic-like serine/threonine-protein kinase